MKIIIVTQYFWPENFPINDLVLGLKDRGHQITVLTGLPNYPEGRLFSGYSWWNRHQDDFQGIRVWRSPLIPRGKRRVTLALNYASFAVSGAIVGPWLAGGQYDVILVYEPSPITVGIPALAMKLVTGAPVLFWVQDLWPESLSATGVVTSNGILAAVAGLVRWIYRGCDRILVQSRAFTPMIQALGVGPDRIIYYPNSTDGHYAPVDVPPDHPHLRLMPSGFRMVFAGNIGEAQDFPTILDAADLLRQREDIHWVIIGDGRKRSWVEQTVRERGLDRTVHLLGRFPSTDMPMFFAMADAMLVTLKKEPIFALTIPSKVQSYLACGRPVVAALDGEGAGVIAEAQAGLTCGAGDSAGLAAAVLQMAELTSERRQAMGHCGRRYFERHFEKHLLLACLETIMEDVTKCAS